MEFNIELPINSLSLGQVGFGILAEMFNRRDSISAHVWPIGQTNLEAFDIPNGFQEWLQDSVSNAIRHVGKKLPLLRLWHISQSERVLANSRSCLWTVHETDQITDVESSICNFYDKCLVTSNYSKEVFNNGGVDAQVCPNFFDSRHFFKKEVKKQGGAINWLLIGKMEKRKQTRETILAWASKYGGNSRHRLNLLINNPFLPNEIQERSLLSMFKTGMPFNINVLPHQVKNSTVNDLMNFCDISLSGNSGAEGFNLPNFNMMCLDKISVVLDAHAHKDYCNENNSVLISPSSTQEIYDQVFFNKGAPTNQGNMFVSSIEDTVKALEIAEDKFHKRDFPTNGEKLQKNYSVVKTVDTLLESLR